ncbi:MAG: hypothetical protein M1548_05775 [Actinobacteria bacterium]|nr:hypothetical protein [Actinomycetota bacterium]
MAPPKIAQRTGDSITDGIIAGMEAIADVGELRGRVAVLERETTLRHEENCRDHGEIKDTLGKIFKRLEKWVPPWFAWASAIATGIIMLLLGLLAGRYFGN